MSSETFLSRQKSNELKAAGLPQPAPAVGQIWWHETEAIPYVIVHIGAGFVRLAYLKDTLYCEVQTVASVVFHKSTYAAPADYIMRHFPTCTLRKSCADRDMFSAFTTEGCEIKAVHANPLAAEVLADLYLKKQKEAQS